MYFYNQRLMQTIDKWLNSFQRVTSNGKFIPEIDGLRFVAITCVVLFHIDGFISNKNQHVYSDASVDYSIWNKVFEQGHFGVELFFVISGFILAFPFANYYLNGGNQPRLGNYYIKRLTRIEPPYFICLVMLYLTLVLVVHKYTFQELFPSFAASMVYLHTIIFPGTLPLVNAVTWSLEIEVQFYLLAPILCKVFMLSANTRRAVLIGLAIVLMYIQVSFTFPFVFLVDYLQYFLFGFLLADFYLTKSNKLIVLGLIILSGVVCFLLIRLYPLESYSGLFLVLKKLFILIGIFAFYYAVLFTNIFQGLFRNKLITVIGGMCYTIYLVHFAIISMVGKFLLNVSFTKFYLLDWFCYTLIFLIFIMLFSAAYFKLIEQPCMQRDWPEKFLRKIKHLI